jgi:outer membrane protein TolC
MAYYDLLESAELLKVSQEEETRYVAHRKDAAARLKAGVVTRNELLQADVLLADSKQRLVTAENNRLLRASRVNSLLMRPLNDAVQALEIVGTPALPLTINDAWAAAEKENPDLRDLDARIKSREETTKAVGAEYLPTVYLSGGYEYSENRYQVHEQNWTVIAGVNVNLFAGGATSARMGVARSEVNSLRYLREKVLDAVRLDVQSAWLDLDSSRRKIDVAYAAVNQASENLRLQRLRYQEGVGTATDVLDAVALMTTAETNAWKANFGLKRAEAALLHAMGRDLATAYPK